jgi:hypothetical protein
MNDTDEREADLWTQRPRMSKQEKLEEIRRMRAELLKEKDTQQ